MSPSSSVRNNLRRNDNTTCALSCSLTCQWVNVRCYYNAPIRSRVNKGASRVSQTRRAYPVPAPYEGRVDSSCRQTLTALRDRAKRNINVDGHFLVGRDRERCSRLETTRSIYGRMTDSSGWPSPLSVSSMALTMGGGPQRKTTVSGPGAGRCFRRISAVIRPVTPVHPLGGCSKT